MTRVFIAGYFGAGNFGDELLLRLMIEALQGTVEPIVVSVDPAHSRFVHQIEAVPGAALPAMLKEADRLIVGPGGLLHNAAGPRAHQRHAGLAHAGRWVQAASETGTPVAVFGVSLGPYRGNTAPQIAERILAAADYACIRDIVHTTPSGRTLPVMPDLSFSLPAFAGPRTAAPALVLREWGSVEHVGWAVNAVLGDGVHRLALQPGDPGEPVSLETSTDARIPFARPLLITMRYHAACLALQSGTPTVVVDLGDPKMVALAAATGIPIVALDDVNAKTIATAIEDAGDAGMAADQLTALRESVNDKVSDLLRWIDSPAASHPMHLPAFPRLRLLGARTTLELAAGRLTS